MLDHVRQKLRVSGGSRATAVNVLGKLRNLVTDAIGNVGTRRNSRVRTEDYGIAAGNRHDGRSGTDFALFQAVIIVVAQQHAGIAVQHSHRRRHG